MADHDLTAPRAPEQGHRDYREFLAARSQLGGNHGFAPLWMPEFLFDFQKHLVEWAIRKGRAALFEDCGLGKTPQFLVWAENVVRKTNRPVLVLTPLTVSHQVVREGEKFGIEVHRSDDGRPRPNITVTNYERLDKFSPDDYSGVVCDECFPAGTPVDTPTGSVHIEKLRPGDKVFSAAGVDDVVAVKSREVFGAVKVEVEGYCCVASPNHPFLTQRGWVGAQSLRAGDFVVESGEAMRLVRQGFSPPVVGERGGAFLRSLLLSEMAHERAGAQGQGSHGRSRREARRVPQPLPPLGVAGGGAGVGPRGRLESHAGQAVSAKDDRYEDQEWHLPPGPGESRRQRGWDDGPGGRLDCRARAGMVTVGGPDQGEARVGAADALQDRLREPRNDGGYRSGRPFAQRQEAGEGQEERPLPGFRRVDRVEVLEQGHPELDRLRDADGKLYFHDLEVARHPIFSVRGLLVHNCSIIKHWSGATQKAVTRFMAKLPYRLLATATAAPNDYVELGTSSEALGELSHSDMLRMFFAYLDDKAQKRDRHRQEAADA